MRRGAARGVIAASLTAPPSWRHLTTEEWTKSARDWVAHPLDEDWRLLAQIWDPTDITLLVGVTKRPPTAEAPAPTVLVFLACKGVSDGARPVVEFQLEATEGLYGWISIVRRPEATSLGGHSGVSATYLTREDSRSYGVVESETEFVAVETGTDEGMVLAVLGGPVKDLTDEVRIQLDQIRQSIQFSFWQEVRCTPEADPAIL